MPTAGESLKVAVYVQHLLGTGHLVRMMHLARALHDRGHKVVLISGGEVTVRSESDFQIVQLPPVKTRPGDFTTLLDRDGKPVDEALKYRRKNLLYNAVATLRPHLLILETFPFGRRQMRFELQPLVEGVSRMETPPLIISSIRDILQQRKEKRILETVEWINTYFDGVLVHGDEAFIPLAESFPQAGEIGRKVHYTGYIDGDTDRSESEIAHQDGVGEVLVSAGGGAVGKELLMAAVRAKPLSELKHLTWRVLIGKNLPPQDIEALAQSRAEQIIIEPNREDFLSLLSRCRVSISQAGYNSCLDIIRSRAKAVLVPFSRYGETEQRQRAAAMVKKGLAVALSEAELNPENLAEAVNNAAALQLPDHPAIRRGGAAASVSILENLYHTHGDKA